MTTRNVNNKVHQEREYETVFKVTYLKEHKSFLFFLQNSTYDSTQKMNDVKVQTQIKWQHDSKAHLPQADVIKPSKSSILPVSRLRSRVHSLIWNIYRSEIFHWSLKFPKNSDQNMLKGTMNIFLTNYEINHFNLRIYFQKVYFELKRRKK